MDNGQDKDRDINPYITGKFMGAEFRFGGKEITYLVIALVIAGPLAYALFLHDQKSDDRWQQVIDSAKAQTESQDATNYILTLNQSEREQLKLSMPKRVREMMRQYEH